MAERSWKDIKQEVESMDTATPRYTHSVRQPTPESAKLKMDGTDGLDHNTETVIEDVIKFDQTPMANLIQAVEVEIRRDPSFRERLQRVVEDVDYMDKPG